MKPDTGELHQLLSPAQQAELRYKLKWKKGREKRLTIQQNITTSKRSHREKWPLFAVGDLHTINGHGFKVVKVNDVKGVISFQSVKYNK